MSRRSERRNSEAVPVKEPVETPRKSRRAQRREAQEMKVISQVVGPPKEESFLEEKPPEEKRLSRRARRKLQQEPNPVMAQIEADSKATKVVAEDSLNKLVALLHDADQLAGALEKSEQLVKQLKTNLENIYKKEIPDLMDSCGVDAITLNDGRNVEVKTKYVGSITKANQENCFQWLEDNGFADIIKHDVTVNIGKGDEQHELYAKLLTSLDANGLNFTDKEHVNPNTLNAFIREQIEEGKDFPQELFKVFPVKMTKVK